jgi:hypothetical protein
VVSRLKRLGREADHSPPAIAKVKKAWIYTSTPQYVFFEVEVNLRPTVSRPACPGVRRSSGTRDQFFFFLEISFRQLRLCCFVAPSLTRGRVCNLLVQLLLGLARAVTLGSKFRRTHGHILLPHLRLPQPGGPGSPIYIPKEQGGPVILPGASSWCSACLVKRRNNFTLPLHHRSTFSGSCLLTCCDTGEGRIITAFRGLPLCARAAEFIIPFQNRCI